MVIGSPLHWSDFPPSFCLKEILDCRSHSKVYFLLQIGVVLENSLLAFLPLRLLYSTYMYVPAFIFVALEENLRQSPPNRHYNVIYIQFCRPHFRLTSSKAAVTFSFIAHTTIYNSIRVVEMRGYQLDSISDKKTYMWNQKVCERMPESRGQNLPDVVV